MLNLREIAARIEYEPVGSPFAGTWLLYLLNRHYFPRQYRDRLRLKPPALLKLKMPNRFPRCYPTRRMVNDGSIYYITALMLRWPRRSALLASFWTSLKSAVAWRS
jgi:hypothetical protein